MSMYNFRELDLTVFAAKGAWRNLVEVVHLEIQSGDVLHAGPGEVAVDAPS
jgi:hypothetical protein